MTTLMDQSTPGGDPSRSGRRKSLVERAAARLGGDAAATRPVDRREAAGWRQASPPPPPPPPPDAVEAGPASDMPPPPPPEPHSQHVLSRSVSIDLDRLAHMGMVTPRGERSAIAEEFRMIKRPLLHEAFTYRPGQERRGNLIMITSSLPAEGKSFTAINLAMSIAKERDVHVLLVDSDLSRPTVCEVLGVEAEQGLTDLLEDHSLGVPDVMLRTNVPNLSIIPAGRPHAMGTELLASQRANALIREMAERYKDRIIIFDSAPALVSAEATALSPHCGQVLLIVEAERTTELEVKGALDVLQSCPNVQLLLNKVRTRFGVRVKGSYEGYYYYPG